MYYSSDSVEEILKCDYCKEPFVEVVKLVPDCGSSICEDCYDSIRESINVLNEFRCRSCGETHIIPSGGFADVKLLMDMLKIKQAAKPLNDKERELKFLLDKVHGRLRNLRSFNGQEEINTYCDMLQMEVIEAVESACMHINKKGDELLEKINNYRNELLKLGSVDQELDTLAQKSAKRFKDANGNGEVEQVSESPSEDEETPAFSHQRRVKIDPVIHKELRDLSAELEGFNRYWKNYFADINHKANELQLINAKGLTLDYDKKVDWLEKKLLDKVFDRHFMKFKEDDELFKLPNLVGRLVFENSMRGQYAKERLVHTLNGFLGNVFQAIFLENGDLATCSSDKAVKVWNPMTGTLLYELGGHSDWIFTMTLLNNGLLATGSRDCTIRIWNVHNRKHIRTLTGHTGPVACLRPLPNGYLASISFDGTIRIWNVFWFGNHLMGIITGHGIDKYSADFSVTPKGLIITCSNEEDRENTIRIWNSKNGALVKSIPTGSRVARSALLLSNGKLAVAFKIGIIKIFDIESDDPQPLKLVIKQEFGAFTLLQLPNGLLASGEIRADPRIKIWDPEDGRLVQTIRSAHMSAVSSLSYCSERNLLVSSSYDRTVKIWSFAY